MSLAEARLGMDASALVPQHKSDVERARAAVAAGYPAVEPVLGALLEWLQDANWPVAHELIPFLRAIGEPLVPHIRHVLQSDDLIWKYWVIGLLIPALPAHVAAVFRLELERLCALALSRPNVSRSWIRRRAACSPILIGAQTPIACR